MTKTVLTIAGSDTLAGGGLQSDIKVFENHQLFGLTAITCVAVVNNHQFEINDLSPSLLQEQLTTIKDHLNVDGIKIGLIHQLESLEIVKSFLRGFVGPIVLDPVMAFKETDRVYSDTYREKLIELFPFATIITPNLKEAEILAQQSITNLDEMALAARKILALGARSVVIKGGERLSGELASDLFYDGEQSEFFSKPKLTQAAINGAGCSFASAITSNLVLGKELIPAISKSKDYVYQGIKNGITLKNGEGNVWFGDSVQTEVMT
ncbi:bifunctional hydroxymethylpyrimidine kinase/phosphomethylpyrimidine kinase [Candidatus Enterococcus murrayae]|uniref:pyridoxal kinase n=1 Tax=Candidatus Enterococcus murrayae TaxID=2815321 RepID=A0ABS3HB08_9ENTE|nr:bifunctional hydroxymethylpyrimidine kinase/phosphomethylpyrimidine kinase [Enterococcus sp. MJM16]MBO0450635.1 bifunctional hydroxymethylpyrimidine kinase/phosphomethylpyrimidine kinase [Enterococcus sp. MJM16]